MNAIYLGVLWLLYYTLHSAFASAPVKRFFQQVFPHVYPHYRAMYSTIAVVNFALLALLHIRLPSAMCFYAPVWAKGLGLIFGIVGFIIVGMAARGYGLHFFYRVESDDDLNVGGLNAYVRHPMYSGVILVMVFLVLYSPSAKNIVFTAVTLAYLLVGIWIEEQRLIAQFGERYLRYRREVKMLVPYVI